MDNLLRFLIVATAGGGFAVAFYIWRQKRRAEALVCPLNSNCATVIHSQYSTFLSLPLELWGMAYYGLVVLTYLSLILSPAARALNLIPLISWLSVLAFLFSLYLTYIQAVKLREWCTWCLISALFCSIIFLTSLALYQ
ncbi:MAG: vitamin K epoxide reductase family protein [Candidatus Vogelbacteria bacterium]|nr:vitamin K epoxide reductase family protein [Candidatus Vogelbacteria bacterium]